MNDIFLVFKRCFYLCACGEKVLFRFEVERLLQEHLVLRKRIFRFADYIFIPKEILDRCLYIAQVNGTPLSKPITTPCDISPQSIFEGMVAAGKANQLNDLETYGNTYFHMPPTTDLCSFFTSGEFTQMVFKAARYKEFWKVFDRAWAEPQARILFNATTNPFTNPDIASPEGIKTNTYLLLSQEIRDIVMPALAEIKELIEQTSL